MLLSEVKLGKKYVIVAIKTSKNQLNERGFYVGGEIEILAKSGTQILLAVSDTVYLLTAQLLHTVEVIDA